MRWILVIVLEVIWVLSAMSAEPIRVENKTFVVQNKTAKKNCVCGDSCKCAVGDCPSKCPVATVPPGTPTVVTYTTIQWPDTAGRMATWEKPSDPKLPWKFRGYCSAFK